MSALRKPRTLDTVSVARPSLGTTPVVSIAHAAGLIWRGPEYPILTAGKYTVRGVRIQGPEWCANFRRWSLRVEFTLIDEPVLVSAFFNLGADPKAQRAGRQSRYYKAWVIANDGHPHKGQRMSPDVFLDGQFFEVEVASCNLDSEGHAKPNAEVYSRVTKVLSATWA